MRAARRSRVRGSRHNINDHFQDRLRPHQNIVIPEAQNTKSAIRQIVLTPPVIFAFRLLATICLDNQTLLERNKNNEPWPDRNRATKL